MIPIINEIKGYDEYVKDYEERRLDPELYPLVDDEILEEAGEICRETEVLRQEEVTSEYVQIMAEEDSIDRQQYTFCLKSV